MAPSTLGAKFPSAPVAASSSALVLLSCAPVFRIALGTMFSCTPAASSALGAPFSSALWVQVHYAQCL